MPPDAPVITTTSACLDMPLLLTDVRDGLSACQTRVSGSLPRPPLGDAHALRFVCRMTIRREDRQRLDAAGSAGSMIDAATDEHAPLRRADRHSPVRTDGYLPIEHYAAVGDGRSLALVEPDGAIDWMCLPSLTPRASSGRCSIQRMAAASSFVPYPLYRQRRRYLERTNVLETTFHTDRGGVRD